VPQAGRKFSRYLDKVSSLSQSLINVIIGSPEAMELYIEIVPSWIAFKPRILMPIKEMIHLPTLFASVVADPIG
jgi:hypothetical protein